MYRRNINFLNSNPENDPNLNDQNVNPPKRKVWLWILALSALLPAIFLIGSLFNKEKVSGSTLAPKQISIFETVKNFIFKPDKILEGQEEDRINILLLGIGGPGHDGPFLSDTNILVSIKPSTKEVALISVPRDLGVRIDGHGTMKINHANAFGEAEKAGGGGDYARKIFEETFQQKIPYYIRVDFKAFEEIINEVGGVTVDVPRTFTDSAFPGPNFSYITVHFDAGVQTLDGQRALIFARSRHGNNNEGSDFSRARRQQMILEALKSKMLSAGTYTNPTKLQSIYGSLKNHVSTNMNFAQLAYLASMAKDIEGSKSLVLDNSANGFLVSTTGESGAFLLSPKTGNFDKINEAISLVFDTVSPSGAIEMVGPAIKEPALSTSSSLKIEIQNGTWIPGLAARIEKKLADKGMNIITIGNSLKRPIPQTTIYVLSPGAEPLQVKSISKTLEAANTPTIPDWLKEDYDNPLTSEDERGMKYNKDADVLVILGVNTKE